MASRRSEAVTDRSADPLGFLGLRKMKKKEKGKEQKRTKAHTSKRRKNKRNEKKHQRKVKECSFQ